MARTTIRRAIMETLEDLNQIDLSKFCFQLRDRREEPRVRRRDVEDKTFLEITDLLLSKFTESEAVKVTLEILRKMSCNEEAKTLESKTKICLDKGDPSFRMTSDGKLELSRSPEAQLYAASRQPLRAAQSNKTVKTHEQMEADAKARVVSEGGDPHNERLVLSRCTLQFGQYKEKSFKWLLENDVSYAVMLVAGHKKERENSSSQNPLMVNKDDLTRYATEYPEVQKEVVFQQKVNEASSQQGHKGRALVGFGRYHSKTLKNLYESNECASYVDYLRSMRSKCTAGTKMEDAVIYVLQRDKIKAAARKKKTWTKGQSTSRPTRRKLRRN